MRTRSTQLLYTLLLLLVLGLLGLGIAYYILGSPLNHKIALLKKERNIIKEFIDLNKNQQERLNMPDLPSRQKALQYASKVPTDREVPRFLLQLRDIAQQTGVNIQSIRIEEEMPEENDYLDLFFQQLTEMAQGQEGNADQTGDEEDGEQEKSINMEQIKQQKQLFLKNTQQFISLLIGDSSHGREEQFDEENDRRTIPEELKRFIPFGMTTYTIEFEGNYQQLTQFLRALSDLPRTVHIDKWMYHFSEERNANPSVNRKRIEITLNTFYYKEKLEEIPNLPALDIRVDEGLPPIQVLPSPTFAQ